MLSEPAFRTIFANAFESLDEDGQLKFDPNMDMDHFGMDSMAIQQLLLTLEEETGRPIPDRVMEQLVEVETLSDFYAKLRDFYVSA